jgi:hypothetical protein
LPGGFYTIEPTLPGYVFDPAARDVDIAGDKSNVDFIAIEQYAYTLAVGLDMVSFPLTPTNLNPAANVPAGVNIARYDPLTATYKYPPDGIPGACEMLPSRSFWMQNTNAAPVDLAIAGDPVNPAIGFTMGVEMGWNMNGNMHDMALPWSHLNITPGQPVRDYGFLYDRATGGYVLVTDIPGMGTTNVIPRNAGFWLKSDSKRTVYVSAVGTAAKAPEKPAFKLAAGDFLAPIIVRAGGRADATSVAGVITGADDTYKIENPPGVSPYVDLYFTDADGKRLACDVRSSAAPTQTWDFVVATDMTDVKVELSLPDLSGIPNDKTVTLVDKATGKRLYARTMTSYTYTADESGLRRFALEIAPKSEAGLMVSSAMAQQTGSGVAVTYSLSKPAAVTVTVVNIAGRQVRGLQASGVASAGANSAVWNLRADNGTRAPAGRYLVRISAVAEDGQAAQALTTVQVGR